MDKRNDRVQPIRLSPDFFPLDIHKSMFINDLAITIPAYYVKSWGNLVIDTHNPENYKWEVDIEYEGPKDSGRLVSHYKAVLWLSFIKKRNKESSYRVKWDKDFAVQLAKDYPKSFVRSLEFHIGDDFYKKQKFTEYDIGGFKEQVQVKIDWDNGMPQVRIKEFFKVRAESQGFPNVYQELSSYLIADYLLSDEQEILRRIHVGEWKPREELKKELNENNLYILLNREKKQVYFGETRQSMAERYPQNRGHHSFEDWTEYCIIQLPPETSDHSRLLIERIVIAIGAKIFPNNLGLGEYIMNITEGWHLMNRKK